MSRVEKITVGVEDRVTVTKFQSLGPSIKVTVAIEPGEDVEVVRRETEELVNEMWEKQLCMRLWWRIRMHQECGAPPPDPWAMKMYEYLYNKYYVEKDGG